MTVLASLDADMTAQASQAVRPIDSSRLWSKVAESRAELLPVSAATDLPAAEAVSKTPAPRLIAEIDSGLQPDMEVLYAGIESPGDDNIRIVTAESGDTLASILSDLDIASKDVKYAIRALKAVFDPRQLRRGQRITAELKPLEYAAPQGGEALSPAEKRELLTLVIKPSVDREVTLRLQPNGEFVAKETVLTLSSRDYRVDGTIETTLSEATVDGRVPSAVSSDFMRLFAYDVDFQRDLKAGDSYEIFFRRYFDRFGDPVKEGEILYAALTTSGTERALYRFVTEDGTEDYYDREGVNARKFLLRTPVDGARVSSGFGMRRHPILGYSRMHRGVDFAAPTGTPIMAAGSGVIEYVGPKGTYGNYIRIRHNGEYETAYAHLSRFGAGIRMGTRVRQGQIIGFVGTTGMSKGPHLHYEILDGGEQVDPTRVKAAGSQRLEGATLAAFEAERDRINKMMSLSPLNGPIASANVSSVNFSTE
ncbi:MAG: M23 family metallopeptidase [Alphaproteobacteria bacterium]|nr:M23 family metallopeptidase [Alphaproteobacteria bacterium]